MLRTPTKRTPIYANSHIYIYMYTYTQALEGLLYYGFGVSADTMSLLLAFWSIGFIRVTGSPKQGAPINPMTLGAVGSGVQAPKYGSIRPQFYTYDGFWGLGPIVFGYLGNLGLA